MTVRAVSGGRRKAIVVLAVVACGTGLMIARVASAESASTEALPGCTVTQLKLRAHLSGGTQSLSGTLTLTNTSERACALPPAARRVSIIVGSQVLPMLTVPMRGRQVPAGTPTRSLPRRGRVIVGIQWRNWCGAPRGIVHASLALTIFPAVTPRVALGAVRTPPCVDHKLSSRVAISRFLKPSR